MQGRDSAAQVDWGVRMISITTEDLAQLAGASVETLEILADRLPKEIDYLLITHPTRGGGTREIVAPASALDTITKNLYRGFLREFSYDPPPHVHGFVRGRSTLTNASAHLAKSCVLRVDLKSFFPSISAARVESAVIEQGLEPNAAALCRRLVTLKDHLPIGLSTSPFLSNLIFSQTDTKLADYCQAHDLSFTRYVDDLTFSGSVHDGHLEDIRHLLGQDGWSINDRKVVFMRRGGPQYVTGLYVGCSDYPRIPRNIKRQLRWVSHVIETVGYETYLEDFGGHEAQMFPRRLLGWARYVASVEPDVGYPILRSFVENIPDTYIIRERHFGEHAVLPKND
jgi:RNA-directed DNA polymerase